MPAPHQIGEMVVVKMIEAINASNLNTAYLTGEGKSIVVEGYCNMCYPFSLSSCKPGTELQPPPDREIFKDEDTLNLALAQMVENNEPQLSERDIWQPLNVTTK